MNLRPLGYEPNELPDCSTPRRVVSYKDNKFILIVKVNFSRILKNKKKPLSCDRGLFNLKPGGVLLSHGEAPHYHRR